MNNATYCTRRQRPSSTNTRDRHERWRQSSHPMRMFLDLYIFLFRPDPVETADLREPIEQTDQKIVKGGKIKSHMDLSRWCIIQHTQARLWWPQHILKIGFLFGRRLWTILFDSFMTDGENKKFFVSFLFVIFLVVLLLLSYTDNKYVIIILNGDINTRGFRWGMQ